MKDFARTSRGKQIMLDDAARNVSILEGNENTVQARITTIMDSAIILDLVTSIRRF